MKEKPEILWRSMLFVPVLNERFIESAQRRGADAIMLDLEDSIPAARKAEARQAVGDAARRLAGDATDVLVRVNRPWRMLVRDLEASVCEAVTAINLPKVDGPEHVEAVAEVLTELEREAGLPSGHTRILAMVECARGLERAGAIAAAHPRLVAITVGAEDLSVSIGGRPVEDLLYHANVRVLTAARAAGIVPIGYIGSVADYEDVDAFRRTADRAAELGFEGGFCVHPAQVRALNEAFSPSPTAVQEAEGIVGAYQAAIREGTGALSYGGRMLDLPVVEQARSLLRRQALIDQKRGE